MLREAASPLSESDAATLFSLRRRLLNIGFGMLLRSYGEIAYRTAALEFDRSFVIPDLADLIDLFCLCKPVRAESVVAAIGSSEVNVLVTHRVLIRQKGLLRLCGLRLIDHFGVFLFVGARAAARTLYFGNDSTALGSWLLGAPHGRCLDLCCGVGTQAILCARHGGEAVGVERNNEAIRIACINAALNGVIGRVRFFEGDLLDAFADNNVASAQELGLFDTVCCNPPLLPAPSEASLPVVADGGEDGLSFTARILAALPSLLELEGRCYVIGTILGSAGQPNVSRIENVIASSGLRGFMVMPSVEDIRSGEPMRSLLECTSILHANGNGGLDSEAAREAWDGLAAHGSHLYSFCLVAARARQNETTQLVFTRHFARNDHFWSV